MKNRHFTSKWSQTTLLHPKVHARVRCCGQELLLKALTIQILASPAGSPSRSRNPADHVSVAFSPVIPGLRLAGLRPATRPTTGGRPFRAVAYVEQDETEFPAVVFRSALSKFTVPELMTMLDEKGLPVTGSKAELLARLEAWLQSPRDVQDFRAKARHMPENDASHQDGALPSLGNAALEESPPDVLAEREKWRSEY